MELAQLAASSPDWRQALAVDADNAEVTRKRKLEKDARVTAEKMRQTAEAKASKAAASKERELRQQKRRAVIQQQESALLSSEEAQRVGSASTALVSTDLGTQQEGGLYHADQATYEDIRLLYQHFFGSQEVGNDADNAPEDIGKEQQLDG